MLYKIYFVRGFSIIKNIFLSSITALNEDGTLGRLVNDNHISPNCEMKKIVYEGKPHLCLFTVTAISPGEEITYSYGDSSYPWRPRVGL